MNCMKCGRKYDSDQAFCPHCLDQMAKNPVRPDVIINLPNRQDVSPKKPLPASGCGPRRSRSSI